MKNVRALSVLFAVFALLALVPGSLMASPEESAVPALQSPAAGPAGPSCATEAAAQAAAPQAEEALDFDAITKAQKVNTCWCSAPRSCPRYYFCEIEGCYCAHI